MKAKSVFSLALILCASCGGSGSGNRTIDPVGPAATAGSPGGYWVGVDSDGLDVVMLADEQGVFYFVAGLLRLATGILTPSAQGNILGVVTLPDDQGFPNNPVSGDCRLEGSFIPRQSMTLDVQCRDIAEQQVFTTLTLNYDPVYERDSSLEMVAGLYRYSGNEIIDISADGTIFSQEGITGCITNGSVVAQNSAYNVYDIDVSFGECLGFESTLRGRTFRGLSMLDDSVVPEELLIIISAPVDNSFVSLLRRAQRL